MFGIEDTDPLIFYKNYVDSKYADILIYWECNSVMNKSDITLDRFIYKGNALAEQSRAEQSRAEQSRAEQSRAEHGLTAPFLRPAGRLKLNTIFVMDNRRT